MFTVITTITRPNTSTVWFTETADGTIIQNMHNDELVVDHTITNSENGLSRITSLTFNSYDDYHTWISKVIQLDSTLFLRRNDYIMSNNFTLKIEEVINGSSPIIDVLI